MPLHNLIFSNKPGWRLQRNLLFWLLWWLYISFCEYLYQIPMPGKARSLYMNLGSPVLLKTFSLVIIYAISCYALLYILLPLLIKREWLLSGLLLLAVSSFLYLATYFLCWTVFPLMERFLGSSGISNYGTKFWPAINLGWIAPLKIVASAVILKYVKNWWVKLKQVESLEREKISTDLRLLKAQVHPDLLFKTLNNIHAHSLAASSRTSTMLLKLSDLLSYMLYECDRLVVPLEKEIKMMKEYMELEKISREDQAETEITTKGEMNGKYIAPFLLLPFIENSFRHCSLMKEQPWINMDIHTEGNNFSMKLTNGVADEFRVQAYSFAGLANVQKRLTLLYPGRYDLKISLEQEMLIVLLNIQLSDSTVYEPGPGEHLFAPEIEHSTVPA